MEIDDAVKPITSTLNAIARFFGQPLCLRVIFPAAAFTVTVFAALAIGFVPLLPANLSDGLLSIETSDLLWIFGITLGAAFLLFGILSRFSYGLLLRFILIWTQQLERSKSHMLKPVLEFIENPESLDAKVDARRSTIKAEKRALKETSAKLSDFLQEAQGDSSAIRETTPSGLHEGVNRRLALIVSAIHAWRLSSELRVVRANLSLFRRHQQRKNRANTGIKALNNAARALNHILELVNRIDREIFNQEEYNPQYKRSAKHRSQLDEPNWSREIEIAAQLNLIVRELQRWRRKLVKSLFKVHELMGYFTSAELREVETSPALDELIRSAKQEDGHSKNLTLRQIVALTELLDRSTLANRETRASSEEYWSEKQPQNKPLEYLSRPVIETVAAIDQLRNQTLMYAGLFMAFVLAGPCVFLVGRILSEQLYWLWLSLSLVLPTLGIIPRRWVVWMAIVVAIRERGIDELARVSV